MISRSSSLYHTKIISGRELADEIYHSLRARTELLYVKPGLALVLVGERPESKQYISMKEKASQIVGVSAKKYELPRDVDQESLLSLVADLNSQPEVHGILVQFPLPHQLDGAAIVTAIDPRKDVDGFHPMNIGRLGRREMDLELSGCLPCTPLGETRESLACVALLLPS